MAALIPDLEFFLAHQNATGSIRCNHHIQGLDAYLELQGFQVF